MTQGLKHRARPANSKSMVVAAMNYLLVYIDVIGRLPKCFSDRSHHVIQMCVFTPLLNGWRLDFWGGKNLNPYFDQTLFPALCACLARSRGCH
jgi:hypothetical protein